MTRIVSAPSFDGERGASGTAGGSLWSMHEQTTPVIPIHSAMQNEIFAARPMVHLILRNKLSTGLGDESRRWDLQAIPAPSPDRRTLVTFLWHWKPRESMAART